MDIRIILSGLRRSGKTLFARSARDFISNSLNATRPQRMDVYYPYISLINRSREEIRKELNALPTVLRKYYDLMIVKKISEATSLRPISLSTTDEATGLEYGSFVLREINGNNLFVVDMHGKDFDVFFHNYILENEGILLSKDKSKIINTLLDGFIRYIEDIGGSSERITRELGKIKGYKDIKKFYSRSRKMLRKTYTGEKDALTPTEVTIAVFFAMITGLRNNEVRTASILIYGPNSIEESHSTINKIRRFRDVVENIRKILSSAPPLIAISHSKIDLLYKEFVFSSDLDPLAYSSRETFLNRYLRNTLSGFEIQSIHAAIHDEEISKALQRGEAYIPLSVPYNVLSTIYAIYEKATSGSTIPREIYNNVLPYPYAYLYFSLSGGIV